METQGGSFTISSQILKFTNQCNNLKITIKNTSLRSTSYDINVADTQHFKLVGHRTFTLAPGISKAIQFQHIKSAYCSNGDKQKKMILVTNSSGKSAIFYCICPNLKVKKEETLIKIPQLIEIGEFNKQTKFIIPIHNSSGSNLKAKFHDLNKMGANFNIISESLIILGGETINLQFQAKKSEYGPLVQTLQLQFDKQEQLHSCIQDKKTQIYQIVIKGDCTNKSLLIKDENSEISEMKIESLNGIDENNHFYIENMYNRDIQYQLSASIIAESPVQYAQKWRSTNITFFNTTGKIIAGKSQMISFKLSAKYTENDENYVKKYNKVRVSDDGTALNLKNSLYSQKNIQLFIKANFKSQNPQEHIPSVSIPIRCLIINPSIRLESKQNEETGETNLRIINQTKASIPFTFSQHSLYRVSRQKGKFSKQSEQIIAIKWTKRGEKCKIFIEIPDFNILVFDPALLKGTITRPASRRPMTSEKIFKERFNKELSVSNNRPASGIGYRPLTAKLPQHSQQTDCLKHIEIFTDFPTNSKDFNLISEQQLDCLRIVQRTIKNNHSKYLILLEIIGVGYLKLGPYQSYTFDDDTKNNIDFRVFGHDNVFKIGPSQDKGFFNTGLNATNFSKEHTQTNNIVNPYKVLSKQLVMSFKEEKHEFQIIDFIPIKNYSGEPLQVHCITIDDQFFHCKEPGNVLMIAPHEVGKFKISFMPKNIVSLRALANQPPKQNRRKAIIQSVIETEIKDIVSKVRRDIKLLINKKIQLIKCVGEIVEKRCSIKPENIFFTECKYGSPETFQTFIITCLSSKQMDFYIQHPEEVVVKPKKGKINPKCAQNCTVFFKPSKKIYNYQSMIKIYISGSHTQILPLTIDVEDPEIFIKESIIQIKQNAICGSQNQELNAQITLVNNTFSQSFIEIDLKNLDIFIGYSKNHTFTPDMKIVQQCFSRRAKFDNAIKTVKAIQKSNLQQHNQVNEETSQFKKKCLVNVLPGSFLKIPITVKIKKSEQGENKMTLDQNLATLVGFGEIKSPKIIRYFCQKTLLHIRPYKKAHDIVLTKNQQGYKIYLKNTTKNTIKIRTQIQQLKTQNDDVTLICTFKDINDYLSPGNSLTLNMNFMFFDIQKHALSAQYCLKFFVAETIEEEKSQTPYFEAQLNVFIPEPFLQINPTKLIMPIMGLNSWSRGSFTISNQGFKQIFIKLKKPSNIVFQLEYSMHTYDPNNKKKYRPPLLGSTVPNSGSTNNPSRKQAIGSQHLQNQLTKMRNCIEIKLAIRSKTPISYNIILEIEDNFQNKYEMMVAGTFTDSPFFAHDNLSVNTVESSYSIPSSKSFTSNQFIISSTDISNRNEKKFKSQLDPIDVDDLLFLNNWLGGLIPQLSGQSTFFYVWLTKMENFIKFLKQFQVVIPQQKDEKKKVNRESHRQKNLSLIFEDMKKMGFHLNSLRVDLLEKADQLQWLNFMWFFFNKQIVSPNFLPWISKNLNEKITYENLSKSYPVMLTNLIKNHFNLTKDNSPRDWPQMVDKYEPLLYIFKNIQSKRHLILSSNILYHRLNNLEKQTIETSELQMTLNIENKQSRKVKYYLLCDTKNLNCEDSSKKTMLTPANGGYTFTLEENQTVELLLSFRNIQAIKKIQSLDIVLMNNIIWDPITLYRIVLKKRDDIYHNVTIQCEQKYSQQWIYTFKSKISSEYRAVLQNSSQFKMITSSNLGYLKKGETVIIKIVYTPDSVDRHEANFIISNNLMKQIFTIKGKPLNSQKVYFETSVKLTEGISQKQIAQIPWQLKTNKLSSISSRAQTIQTSTSFQVEFFQKSFSEVREMSAEYFFFKKEIKLSLLINFEKKYRDLEILLRISNNQLGEQKIIKIIVNVAPKPVFIRAEIQAESSPVVEQIIVPNIYNLPQTVHFECKKIQSEEEVTKMQKKMSHHYKPSYSQHPIELINIKNGDNLSFKNKTEITKQLSFKIKYNPNVERNKQASLYHVCLTYSESLLKVHYIFVGRAIIRTNRMGQDTQKSIKHEIIPLKKYRKSIQIYNPRPHPIKFEISTDLHQISGKSTLLVGANATSAYEYEIYCLHYINKQGTIVFKGNYNNQEIVHTYCIDLSVRQNEKQCADQAEIKIFRGQYLVQSVIRMQKIFTIYLSNKSDRSVDYEILCDSKFLKPLTNKIRLEPNSQGGLDVKYLPLFIGECKGILTFYNPYQPQITYKILMKSSDTFTTIKEVMPGIGENKTIKLPFINPTEFSTQISLTSVFFNNEQIKDWEKHLRLVDQTKENISSFQKFKINAQQHITLNLIIPPLSLQENYKYELKFKSEQLGQFRFDIEYTYPKKQIMNPINLHIRQNSSVQGIIYFLNRFQLPLELEFLYDKDSLSITDFSHLKSNNLKVFTLNSLTKTQVNFKVESTGRPLQFKIISEGFTWIYPIVIYKICEIVKTPLLLRGITGQKIKTKLFPMGVSTLSGILIADKQQKVESASSSFINLQIISQSVRGRKRADNYIQKHQCLSSKFIFEVEISIMAMKGMRLQGYFYMYSSNRRLNVSETISSQQKISLKEEHKEEQYIVQKIPFQVIIEQPAIKTVQLMANVGQQACAKLKITDLFPDPIIYTKQWSQSKKAMDGNLAETNLNDHIILQLYNNKSQQFSGELSSDGDYIQIWYRPNEYSTLKKAKLEIKVNNTTFQLLLVGKYPPK